MFYVWTKTHAAVTYGFQSTEEKNQNKCFDKNNFNISAVSVCCQLTYSASESLQFSFSPIACHICILKDRDNQWSVTINMRTSELQKQIIQAAVYLCRVSVLLKWSVFTLSSSLIYSGLKQTHVNIFFSLFYLTFGFKTSNTHKSLSASDVLHDLLFFSIRGNLKLISTFALKK